MKNSSGRRSALAIISALTVAVLAVGCTGASTASDAQAGAAGGTLTLAVALDSGGFDTALLQNGNQAQFWTPVYDTLLRMESDTTIVPNLAESFEYNEDRTVLTLKLREGVTFTDGTAFNADAVKANVEHLKAGTGQNAVMVSSVDDVVVVDDLTAELHLNAPNPAMLTYLTLAAGAMGSPTAIVKPEIAGEPVGSGPYMLDVAQTEPGVSFTYVRNPDYWDSDAFPYDQLKLLVITDLTARLNALRSGQVQGMIADGSAVTEAESTGLSVYETPLNRVGLYLADRDGSVVPALADPRVRQAINYAVDSEGILSGIQLGFGARSTQIFNPNSEAFVDELTDAYPFDPEKARDLLADAGYANGFDVLMPDNTTTKANPIVQQQLADVGIRVTYEKVDATNYVAEVQSGKYGMFWMSNSTADSWWDMTKQVPVGAPWNPFDSTTPELQGLIDAAQGATGTEFETAMQAISAYLVENAWFDIWYLENVIYITSPNVSVDPNPINIVPFIRDFTPAG